MKRHLFASVLLCAALVLAACNPAQTTQPPDATTSPASTSPAPADVVEITVITSYGGDDGNRLNYEKAIAGYELATGNFVNDSSSVSNEEWKARITEAFASGTEPDILFFFTGADANQMIEDGKVVSIDEIRKVYPDYASNMKDDVLPRSPTDGVSYAVPVNGYWEGLFVNKKVLADCGVDVPDANTSWDEFLRMCQTIKDKGYTPIAVSLCEIPHYWFEFCTFNNSNPEKHTMLPLSADDDIGQIWANGLGDIKELYDLGFLPENTLEALSAETDALIINDKAAFMIDGSWKLGWFAENAADINDFTVTYVPANGERKTTDIIGGLSMGYYITQKAWNNPEKQAACVEFVMAMTTDEVVATFGATAVTALKNGIEPPDEASGMVRDALSMTGNVTAVVGATADNLSQVSRGVLFAGVPDVVTGKMTPSAAVAAALAVKD